MRRFTIILALVAFAAVSPAAALGKSKASSRPMSGTGSSTTIVDLATGTGSVAGGGRVSQLGKFKFTNDITSFTLTGPGHVRPHPHGNHRGGQRRQALHSRYREGDADADRKRDHAGQQDHRRDRSLRPRPAGRSPARSAAKSSRPSARPPRPATPRLTEDESGTRRDSASGCWEVA